MRGSAAAQNGLRPLFVINHITAIILRAAPSFDEFDGRLELSELLNQWPPEGCGRYHRKHLEIVRRYFKNRHWACQALTVLNLTGMVNNTGMQKNRRHIKKCGTLLRRTRHISHAQ
eukprot:7134703-Pyramimonas_sp.AAC.1